MRPDSKSLLHDILAAIRAVRAFVDRGTFDEYRKDELVRSAVERKLEIIGEALSLLHKRDPQTAERLPEHRSVISFRNILIHGYSRVDHEIVWSVITTKLDGLEAAARGLLDDSH